MESQLSSALSHQIVNLNNAGVSALAASHEAIALRTFKSALTMMGSAPDIGMLDMMDCVSPASPLCGLQDPYFYVYNRPFLLGPSGQTAIPLIHACLMFNLGLTFHHRGHQCGDSSKLVKALRLYDLAAQVVLESSPSFAAIALAALNDQAHIYHCFADYAQSQERLERVRECADLVLDEGSVPVLQSDLNEIWLNVAIVRPPTLAPCA